MVRDEFHDLIRQQTHEGFAQDVLDKLHSRLDLACFHFHDRVKRIRDTEPT